jgi:polysaccharide biosynthesis/export protein
MKASIKLIVILILFIQVNSYTQIISSDKSTTSQLQTNNFGVNTDANQLLSSINETGTYAPGYPVEGVVDAEKYIVGQGDLFSLGLYGYLNQVLALTVSIEGTIIIPTVGEVDINGYTLKKAKEKVITAVKKRYYTSDVSFTLVQPRTFLIQVSGLTQGTYAITSLTRPSQVLSKILFDTLNFQKRAESKSYGDFLPKYSFRNIELIRKDGTIVRVDIYKYFATKDDKYNPTFKEGDLLKIPSTNLNANCISVNGAVQLSGNYEYSKDDDLETVIDLGRGFDANAELDSIVLFRPSGQTKGFETYNLSYEKDKNFKINVFDRVFVKYKTENIKMISVQIMGEIVRPGIYPITFKNTRLKDIVEIAGGFTSNAYLPLCIILRSYDQEYLKRDTMEIFINRRANDLIVTDKDKLNFEEDILGRRNRVVVDFEKLFLENDETQNIIIEDKDVIYINDDKKSVYVYGQVQNEGYIPYKKGETIEYYIEKAGGYSLSADKGDARIIKFNTRGWYKPGDTEINSGDFIYIPKVIKKSFTETITLVSQITGVILGVISTYLLIKSTSK